MKKDIRLELRSINDIKELREYLEELCKLPKEKLCDLWSLSEEDFSDQDVEDVKNSVRTLLRERFEDFKSLSGDVVIKQYFPEDDEPEEDEIITYLCPLEMINSLSKKYMSYDPILRNYSEEDPEWKFSENYYDIDISEMKDSVCLVRLIYPSQFDRRHSPRIQIFPCELMEMKSNVYMPWGPYEFTCFCGTEPYEKITREDLEKDLKEFIKKYNVQKCK